VENDSLLRLRPGDVDTAFDELDARYLVGEGAPFADVYRTASTWWGLTDDVVFVDHRPGGFGSPRSEEELARISASARELPRTSSSRVVRVLAIDRDAAVLHHVATREVDGAPYEWSFLRLAVVDGERLSRVEIFEVTDVDEALARFASLGATRLENESCRASDRLAAAIGAGRWDDAADLLHDDFTFIPPRPTASANDKGSFLETARSTQDVWASRPRTTVLAIRGERLSLARRTIERRDGGNDPFIRESLSVREIDEQGLIIAAVYYEPDNLGAAFEELDRRYVAGEGADTPLLTANHPLAPSLHRGRKWDEYRAICDDDLVVIDHRPGGWGRIQGADAWIEHSKKLVEIAPDVNFYGAANYRITENGSLRRVLMIASEGTGGHVEAEFVGLARFAGPPDARRFVRLENFALEDLEAALQRFDELEGASPEPIENECSRAVDRFRDFVQLRNWDEVASCLAEDVVVVAMRPMGRRLIGRDAFMTWQRTEPETWGQVVDRTTSVLAVRGGRLSLRRLLMTVTDDHALGLMNDVLIVNEIDEAGSITAIISFEAEDLAGAFHELDRRYAEGEGAEYAEQLSWLDEYHAVLRARDWDRTRTYIAEDAVVIDHRPRGWGTIHGAEAWVAHARPMFEQSPDYASYARINHRLSSRGAVRHFMNVGTNLSGGEVSDEYLSLSYRNPDGLMWRWEVYPLDRLDEALRRFDELERSVPPLRNASTRISRKLGPLVAERDWNAIGQLLSDDFVWHHWETMRSNDKHAYIDAMRTDIAVWGELDRSTTTLAIRGERLALLRLTQARVDDVVEPDVADILAVRELDERGLLRADIFFAPDDFDAALEELDARYIAGEAAPFADVFRVARARTPFTDASAFADDFVSIDHRPGSQLLDTTSKAELTDVLYMGGRSIASAHVIAVHALDHRGAVVQTLVRDDHDFEWGFIFVRWVRGGKIVRSDAFSDDQREDALAFFASHRAPARLENACIRHRALWGDAIVRRDFERLRQLAAPDYVSERRIAHDLVPSQMDIDEFIAWVRTQDDAGYTHTTSPADPIAIRGETLALFPVEVRSDGDPGAFSYETLIVREITRDGLAKRSVYFEPADLRAAFDELDELYMAGEAAPFADVFRVARSSVVRTPEAFASDVVATDHRPGARYSITGREHLRSWATQQIRQLKRPEGGFTAVHVLSERGAVLQNVLREGADDANAVEYARIFVRFVENGQVVRQDVFADNQLDEALVLFGGLA
jgi:hypothetical protein